MKSLLEGFTFGLTCLPMCMGHCLPIFVPLVVAGGRGGIRIPLLILLQFFSGRFAGYLFFGVISGVLGGAFFGRGGEPWIGASQILFSLLLLIFTLGKWESSKSFCILLGKAGKRLKIPFLVGLVTGFHLCPTFALVFTEAFSHGKVSEAILLFIGLFLGTNLPLMPFGLFGLASKIGYIRRVGRVTALIVAAFFFYRGAGVFIEPPPGTPAYTVTEEKLKKAFPSADSYSEQLGKKEGVTPYYEAYDSEKHPMGILFVTTDLFPQIRGFAGPVPVLVGLTTQGDVTGISILDNDETPSYVYKIYEEEDFLKYFRGKQFDSPFKPGEDIAGITGATVTVETIGRSVALSSREMALRHFGLVEKSPLLSQWGPERGIFTLLNMGIFLLFLAAFLGITVAPPAFRYVVLLAAVAFLGFYRAHFFSFVDIGKALQCLQGDWPTTASQFGWYFFMVLILLSTLMAGRLFCGWICPFGALSEILYRIFPFKEKARISWRLDRNLRTLKYAILFLAPLLFVATGKLNVLGFEPFSMTFTFRGGKMEAKLLPLFLLFAGLFIGRFWCRYLCPSGAFLALLSTLKIFPIPREVEVCTLCGKCMDTCPIDARIKGADQRIGRELQECLGCRGCESTCMKVLRTRKERISQGKKFPLK